ncbi:Uncharacterised protein [Mycobacterium tuberculosis]|nr:Uncharacterised protein [Mycobacterium tuberculosis]
MHSRQRHSSRRRMSASRMACLEENERYSPGPAMPAPLPISLVLTAG